MKNKTNELIKQRRLELGLTLEDVARALGVNRSTVLRYESKDIEKMPIDIIPPLAKILRCSPEYLMGWVEEDKSNELIHAITKIPVYAPLCCGSGLFVDDEIIDYVAIPTESLQSHKEYFGQYAKGDSMIGAGINDGDILIFEKINGIISQGQIGCFCIDENIATCKKMVIAEDSTVYLMPANENYPPITITVENSCFRCIGKLAFVVSDRRGK